MRVNLLQKICISRTINIRKKPFEQIENGLVFWQTRLEINLSTFQNLKSTLFQNVFLNCCQFKINLKCNFPQSTWKVTRFKLCFIILWHKWNTHPFILVVDVTLKQVAIKEITDNFNILVSDCGVWTVLI